MRECFALVTAALLLLVEIQCAQVEQNETKSQSPLTLIGKGRVYGMLNMR